MDSESFGLRACGRHLSALHAEIAHDYESMDWPTFATEIERFQRLRKDFEDVNLIHILRSRNGGRRR
ncbi:hypothetical protein F2Q70_00009444 [Brassica cretica]|uniref:Uncharacterized protein n=1 Tax=Brassica cretica TaxID=69181 RepID=A0A8S9MA87_BRACR|nr:hypothetical protein F2Q70_00009444 [Brassica cretica]